MEGKIVPVDIIEFLNTLETLPCLWQKSHPKYKVRSARDTAEDYLLDVFKKNFTNKKELRGKLRNIRNTYNAEIKKIQASIKTGTSPDEIYKPKLFWFEEAHRFLSRNVGEAPNVFCNLAEEETEQPDNTSHDNDPPPVIIEDVQTFITEDEMQDDLIELSITDLNAEPNAEPNKKRKRKNSFMAEKKPALEKTVAILESLRKQREMKIKDEFSVFGDSVGKQLQELPKKEAINLQLQIQTLLSNARLAFLESVD